MDPLEHLPVEIHEHFLSYFSANEAIQTLSVLSKKWYSTVANSQRVMKKVLLVMRNRRKNDFQERVATLRWMSRTDGRPYQNVQMNCLLDIGISVETWAFLHAAADNIVSLNIRSIKLDNNIETPWLTELPRFAIPKLEELQIMFIPRDQINSLIISSSLLKKLILRNEFALCYDEIDYDPNHGTICCMRQFLARNKDLEELEIQGRPNVFAFLHQYLEEYKKIQVKKLSIKIEMTPGKIAENHRENMIKFLTSQSETVEYLYIDQCGIEVVEHCLTKMPKVDFLRLDNEQRDPDKFSIKELNLPVNEKITKFEMAYVRSFDVVKEYLDLLPNVEEILIGFLTPQAIDYAANNLEKLKVIRFRYDECAGGHEEAYNVFKLDNPETNHNIQFSYYSDFL